MLNAQSMDDEVDSPNSSRAYEADVSLSESYGSVALSEALATETPPRPPPVLHVRPDPTPKLSSVRQQVELIRAQGRIVQLESELASAKRAHKRARIEEESGYSILGQEEEERLHKLEQERCAILEDLTANKTELEATKIELKELTNKLEQVSQSSAHEIKQLQEQLTELRDELDDSQGDREMLRSELAELRLGQASRELQQLDSLRETHRRSLESLQSRLKAAEQLESSLRASEGRVRELERQLKSTRQDSYFIKTVREKLMQYDEMERQCQQLTEENAVLCQARDNQHLLRYKVQELQERCERLQPLEAEVARLSLEKTELKTRLEGWADNSSMASGGGPTLALLQYRIAQLQNNEKALVHKRGELESQVHEAEQEARLANQSLKEVKVQLTKEQQGSKVKDDRIQRLEKRLLFVSKEREGCMSVLNSYTRDSGVDGLLRQNIAELEAQLERANNRITELETELDHHSN